MFSFAKRLLKNYRWVTACAMYQKEEFERSEQNLQKLIRRGEFLERARSLLATIRIGQDRDQDAIDILEENIKNIEKMEIENGNLGYLEQYCRFYRAITLGEPHDQYLQNAVECDADENLRLDLPLYFEDNIG